MCLPVVQLVEQRLITPAVLIVRSKTGDSLAITAALWLLATSLPRKIAQLLAAAGADADDTGGGATGDAGDDDGGGCVDSAESQVSMNVDAEMIVNAATGATRLAGRALAAKEAAAKDIAPAVPVPATVIVGGRTVRKQAWANPDEAVDDDDGGDD